jgi:hypothetical protein
VTRRSRERRPCYSDTTIMKACGTKRPGAGLVDTSLDVMKEVSVELDHLDGLHVEEVTR